MEGGGVGVPALWFRHILGSSCWVSFLYEEGVVSSIITSIITFNMVINAARIMKRYNPHKVIVRMTLKSIFVS